MFRYFSTALLLAILLFTPLLTSCGDSYADAVGAPCSRHADCPAGGRCLTGGKFPGGSCSFACNHESDCPAGTACIDREGGVCLPLCHDSRDCRERYTCDDERNRGRGGRSNVCIND